MFGESIQRIIHPVLFLLLSAFLLVACEGSGAADSPEKDTTPPVITLNGNNAVTLVLGEDTYVEAGASATDNIDGSEIGRASCRERVGLYV